MLKRMMCVVLGAALWFAPTAGAKPPDLPSDCTGTCVCPCLAVPEFEIEIDFASHDLMDRINSFLSVPTGWPCVDTISPMIWSMVAQIFVDPYDPGEGAELSSCDPPSQETTQNTQNGQVREEEAANT